MRKIMFTLFIFLVASIVNAYGWSYETLEDVRGRMVEITLHNGNTMTGYVHDVVVSNVNRHVTSGQYEVDYNTRHRSGTVKNVDMNAVSDQRRVFIILRNVNGRHGYETKVDSSYVVCLHVRKW